MTRLTKYEKETIILTSEGDDTYSVYTFNPALKRRLADFFKEVSGTLPSGIRG